MSALRTKHNKTVHSRVDLFSGGGTGEILGERRGGDGGSDEKGGSDLDHFEYR